jgi:hypothetical protein
MSRSESSGAEQKKIVKFSEADFQRMEEAQERQEELSNG